MASTRLREFDILKGLLIICVVIGHTVKTPYINVFWFHVPAFFLIAGYFAKIPANNPLTNKEQWRKWACRFIVPYLSWSTILYCQFRPEGILKNLVRTLYGGLNNVTLYSYPFWFVNALLLSTVFFSSLLYVLHKRKISIGGDYCDGNFVLDRYTCKGDIPIDIPFAMGHGSSLGCIGVHGNRLHAARKMLEEMACCVPIIGYCLYCRLPNFSIY